MQRLVDKGNSILVIEHNLDVIRCSDWIIDLGPEGGDKGGQIVVMWNPRTGGGPSHITHGALSQAGAGAASVGFRSTIGSLQVMTSQLSHSPRNPHLVDAVSANHTTR